MESHNLEPYKVVSHDEWVAARKAHLLEEKAFTKARDALSRKRRELPWEKVEKTYLFDGPNGKETLADLFRGKSQLFVYHFMLGPGWEAGCPSCSLVADHFDGAIVHLAQRDIACAVVSRASLPEIQKFKDRMGWRFKWVSSFGTDFNHDYQVSVSPEEKAAGKVLYNYELTTFPSEERPGASVFYKNDADDIFHTYSSYGRGLDILIGAYNIIDLVPKGRDETGLAFSMAWVRHHDRYDAAAVDTKASYQQPKSASCCD
ncbi:MAG TPA: thioredoxin family protein [Xanthobacteraceae bacterium]|nr:thioredoxin family protein [Xanthobacteraceae bacterium]